MYQDCTILLSVSNVSLDMIPGYPKENRAVTSETCRLFISPMGFDRELDKVEALPKKKKATRQYEILK